MDDYILCLLEESKIHQDAAISLLKASQHIRRITKNGDIDRKEALAIIEILNRIALDEMSKANHFRKKYFATIDKSKAGKTSDN